MMALQLVDRKNEENRKTKNVCVQKSTDFSIEHILLRAGDKEPSLVEESRSLETCFIPIRLESDQPNITFEMFDWMHYTRYKPPKVPRPFRTTPVKRTPGRLPRVPFTPIQLKSLEEAYRLSTYLSAEEANKLALELGLTNTRVKIWFQNRRARERREKREDQNKSLLLNAQNSK